MRVEVDGQEFEVEKGQGGSYHYSALCGPHPSSGFAVGRPGPEPFSHREHVELITDWLREIDPCTGYFPEDS